MLNRGPKRLSISLNLTSPIGFNLLNNMVYLTNIFSPRLNAICCSKILFRIN